MPHVWIVNQYACTPGQSGGTRHYSLATHLIKQGWDVSIIRANSNYLGMLSNSETKVYKEKVDVVDGVKFLNLQVKSYRGNGLQRLISMLDFSFQVLMVSKTNLLQPPDIIIGSSVHPFGAFAAKLRASRYRVPFIFEVRDLWPESLIAMGKTSKYGPLAFVLRCIEKYLYQTSSSIVTVLEHAHKYIGKFGVSSEKIEWIPNGVELENYKITKRNLDRPKTFFDFYYFGAIGEANGLETLIAAFNLIFKSGTSLERVPRLTIFGDGPLRKQLVEEVATQKLVNVVFENPVPKEHVPFFASKADAFVICVRDLPELYRYGISMNKLFDYMAAEKPTLISTNVLENPIAKALGGKIVPADSPEHLAVGVVNMTQTKKAVLDLMGKNAKNYVAEHHSYRSLAKKLNATLWSCLQSNN